MVYNIVAAVIIGYLLGALPSAYLAGRLFKGIDIRQTDGGNVGALNTLREIGLVPGILVMVADIAKGALAVFVARWLDASLPWVLVTGFAAVAGHIWPVFLRFRGGKGAATTLGVFFAVLPAEMGISLAIIALITVVTSNVRLAIIIGLVFLPIIVWQLNGSITFIIYTAALALLLLAISFTGMKQAVTDSHQKRNLIIDRDYHFWQARKKPKSEP